MTAKGPHHVNLAPGLADFLRNAYHAQHGNDDARSAHASPSKHGGSQSEGRSQSPLPALFSLKYNFKPESVADSTRGVLHNPSSSSTAGWQLELDAGATLSNSSLDTPTSSPTKATGLSKKPAHTFSGSQSSARNLDCVLVWDPRSRSYTLDRLAATLTLKFERSKTNLSDAADQVLSGQSHIANRKRTTSPPAPSSSSNSSMQRTTSRGSLDMDRGPRSLSAQARPAADRLNSQRSLHSTRAQVEEFDDLEVESRFIANETECRGKQGDVAVKASASMSKPKEDSTLKHQTQETAKLLKRASSIDSAEERRKRPKAPESPTTSEHEKSKQSEHADMYEGDELAMALEMELEMQLDRESEDESAAEHLRKVREDLHSGQRDAHMTVAKSPTTSPGLSNDELARTTSTKVHVDDLSRKMAPDRSTPVRGDVNTESPAAPSEWARLHPLRRGELQRQASEDSHRTLDTIPTPGVGSSPLLAGVAEVESVVEDDKISPPSPQAFIGLGLRQTGSGITPISSPATGMSRGPSREGGSVADGKSREIGTAPSPNAVVWKPKPIPRNLGTEQTFEDEEDDSEDADEDEDDDDDDGDEDEEDDDDDDGLEDFAAELDMSLAEPATPVEPAKPSIIAQVDTSRRGSIQSRRTSLPQQAKSSSASQSRARKVYGLGGRREEEDDLEDSD